MERQKKVPYTPSPERFKISEDPISRERYKAVKESCDELQKKFPGVNLAFSLFGSLTKGKVLTEETAKKTDIDLHIFFDEADFISSPYYSEIKRKVKEEGVTFPITSFGEQSIYKKDYIRKRFGWHLKNELQALMESRLSDKDTQIQLLSSPIGKELKNFDSISGEIFAGGWQSHLFTGLDIGGKLFPYTQAYLRKARFFPGRDANMSMLKKRTINEERHSPKVETFDEAIEKSGLSEEGQKQYPETFQDAAKKYDIDRPRPF